jgi:hypothetical protein
MKRYARGRYRMATTAIHQCGDISREKPDLCLVHAEDEENYYGQWVRGFGFINVRFPKATTRKLTPEEVERENGRVVGVAGSWHYEIKIDAEEMASA